MRLPTSRNTLPTIDPSKLSYTPHRLKMPFSWRVGQVLQGFEKATDSLKKTVGECMVSIRRKLAKFIQPDNK